MQINTKSLDEIKDLDQTLIRQNLKVKFETFERINENELLRNKAYFNNYRIASQRKIIWGVGIFVFILLILFIIIVRLYHDKQNVNKALVEQQRILILNNKNLEQINTKEQPFSIVAHDVKSSVSAIVTSVNMLSENRRVFSKLEMDELTTDLSYQAEGLYVLLEGVLTWARSQMDGYNFHPNPMDILDFFQDMTHAEERAVLHKNLRLAIDILPGQIVHVDKQVLEAILRNFFNNAMKFTPREAALRSRAVWVRTRTLVCSSKKSGR